MMPVLRTNMTDNMSWPKGTGRTYANIKQYVYNSIYLRFIKDESIKRLLEDLDYDSQLLANFPIK
jgi:hypothetical protein